MPTATLGLLPSESSLNQRQEECNNLTSYNPYPFPGRLVEVPYPVDSSWQVVPPELLLQYAEDYMFEMPCCYHGKAAIVTVDEIAGEKRTSLRCSIPVPLDQCSYIAYTDNFANNRNGRTNFCRYAPRNLSSKPPSYHRPESREQLPPDSESDASSIPELESVSSSVAFSLSENLSEEVINVENGQSSILFGTDCTKTAPHQRRTRSFDNFGTLGDLPGPRRVERSFLSASCSPNSLVPVELNAPEGGTEDQLPYLVNSEPNYSLDANLQNAMENSVYHTIQYPGCTIRSGSIYDMLGGEQVGGDLDGESFPLLTRPDGLPAISTCLNPDTQEFDEDLFMNQVMLNDYLPQADF